VKPGILWHDTARLWRAGRAHLRERKSARRLDLGLAFLEIEGEPVPGEILTARTAVTELGPGPRAVQIVLDFWQEGGLDTARGHVGGVVAAMTTEPRRRLELKISTDGGGHGKAWCRGEPLECRSLPGEAPWGDSCVAIVALRSGEEEIDRIVARPRWKVTGA
jgi:hypothetical protein